MTYNHKLSFDCILQRNFNRRSVLLPNFLEYNSGRMNCCLIENPHRSRKGHDVPVMSRWFDRLLALQGVRSDLWNIKTSFELEKMLKVSHRTLKRENIDFAQRCVERAHQSYVNRIPRETGHSPVKTWKFSMTQKRFVEIVELCTLQVRNYWIFRLISVRSDQKPNCVF